MSSLAGWSKVASGLRIVASAAATHASEQGGVAAASVARHGVEVASSARVAAAAAAKTSGVDFTAAASFVPVSDGGFSVNGDAVMRDTNIMESVEDETNAASSILQASSSFSASESAAAALSSVSDSIENVASEKDPDTSTITNTIHETKTREESHNIDDVHTKRTIDAHSEGQKLLHLDDDQNLLEEGRAVPSTRVGRAIGFASLGVGLAAGAAVEIASRAIGASSSSKSPHDDSHISPMASDANADRLAASLCRMRGAAMKLGQMMSIQDETILPPTLSRALDKVRQGAEAMPSSQLYSQLETQLGEGWREKIIEFEERPFAAASIGQVHRAIIPWDNVEGKKKVVMKVQYPGVSESIDSDLNNLSMIVKMSGFAPPGLFIENVIRVGREELKVECDYLREVKNQIKFKELVESDDELPCQKFSVPGVIEDLTTSQILTTEFAPGGTIDKVSNLDQSERNRIGRNILLLTMRELFTWRFMQTDPNWGNFLYDMGTRTTSLIDFGAAREYDDKFVDGYLKIVWANANRDEDLLFEESKRMGFLTGEENSIMMEAHKMSGFTLGEPFASDEPYDFRGSKITGRISEHGSAFLHHRLTPPPEEVYTLHRKLAGAYNLCIKLGAVVQCRDLLEEVMDNHVFESRYHSEQPRSVQSSEAASSGGNAHASLSLD